MEKQFLIDDLKIGEAWRLFKIIGEFVEGVESLHDIGPAGDGGCGPALDPGDPRAGRQESGDRAGRCAA